MVCTSLGSTVVPAMRTDQADGCSSICPSGWGGILTDAEKECSLMMLKHIFCVLHGPRKLYMRFIGDLRTSAAPNHTRSPSTEVWSLSLMSVAVVCKNLAHSSKDHPVCRGIFSPILTPAPRHSWIVDRGAMSQQHMSTSYPGVKYTHTAI